MTTTQITALTAPTQFAREAADGVTYAYRRFGGASDVPLLMLQHFRGNLDNWDPAFIDALAAEREVILVDYAGVSSSTGLPAHTVAETARQVIAFADAIGLTRMDLLGFSLGGFVAQDVALTRPALVRRLVLAGTGPQGAPGTHGWRQDIADHARADNPGGEDLLYIFFAHTETSQAKGVEFLGRFPAAGRGPRHGEQPRRPRRRARLGYPGPRRAAAAHRDQDADPDHPGRQRPDDPDQAQSPHGRADPGRHAPDLPGRGTCLPLPVPAGGRGGREHVPRLAWLTWLTWLAWHAAGLVQMVDGVTRLSR